MIVRPKLVSSIVVVNVTPQIGAYLTIIIYDHKIIIVQATGGRQWQLILPIKLGKVGLIFDPDPQGFTINSRAKCQKTFYIHNL
jgi:hypothetical protein